MTKYRDRNDMVRELGLAHHRMLADDCDVWVWPAEHNGTKYDRFVVIEMFSDGSAAIYLGTGATGAKAQCVALRSMVED